VKGPGGRAITADIEVTADEPDTAVAFRAIAGPVRPRGDDTMREADNATEVTFTLDAELSGLKKLFMGNAVQKTTDAEVAALTEPGAFWNLAPEGRIADRRSGQDGGFDDGSDRVCPRARQVRTSGKLPLNDRGTRAPASKSAPARLHAQGQV
jgi:hypothetical protein